MREALEMSIERGQIEPAPVDPLARVLLEGVTAAAEPSPAPRTRWRRGEDAGLTIELIVGQLRRTGVGSAL